MNITDLLNELKIPYRRHGESPKVSDGWLGLMCPWCGHGPWYLGIHLSSGRVSCWSCGRHSLTDVVVAICDVTPADAMRLTAGLERTRPPDRPAAAKLEMPDGLCELLPAHRRYLQSRHLDPDEVSELWRVQGFGPVGQFRWRVFIPIHDHTGGRVVSWTTRAIGDVSSGGRYRSARGDQSAVPRSDVLYGEHHARHAVIVCEGYFDVFRIGPGGVCSAGLGFSRAQVRRIARRPVRAVCFDAEPNARRRAERLCDQLAAFPGTTHLVTLESSKDPADADRAELAELRKKFLT